METAEASKKSLLYKKTTLDELGPNLPIIRRTSTGEFVKERSFSFHEWDMETEEKISKIQKKSNNVGHMVNKMLCLLIDEFCGQKFSDLPREQQILTINQLEFTNVMYAYIYLRTEELGYDLKMDVTCPTCNKLNKDFVADLRTLEIHVKDEDHERLHTYELVKPILLDDGKVVKAIEYDISKWDTMERATPEVAENAGKMKQTLFKSSIQKAILEDDDEKFVPVENVIKRLKKVDIERVSNLITENNAGPLMALKGNCVHCGAEWFRMLDWSYNYFFDSSSL